MRVYKPDPGQVWTSQGLGWNSKKRPWGFVYHLSHPSVVPVYIGKAIDLRSRKSEHHRDALQAEIEKIRSGTRGDGKLHAAMQAFPDGWVIIPLYVAEDEAEAAEMENYFQHWFDSVKAGLNKVYAPATVNRKRSPAIIEVDGQEYPYTSAADLCRQLGISASTVNHWEKKGKSFEAAVKKALEAAATTQDREPIEIGRRVFETVPSALNDKRANRYNLSLAVIKRRRADGMTWHDAFTTPPSRKPRPPISLVVNGVKLTFDTVRKAHDALTGEGHQLPPYQTVIANLNKKQPNEQAFGFQPPPWQKTRWKEADRLIQNQGFTLVGEKRHEGMPVILRETKEVFGSIKAFSGAFNLDYTTTAERLKLVSPAILLIDLKHPVANGWKPRK